MAKRMDATKKEITKHEGVVGGFLSQYVDQDQSLDTLNEYVIVPRIKIIQSMTAQDLKDKIGGDGTVCVRPGDSLIARPKESFHFVPLFFFPEWIKWADLNDKQGPRIVERSFDPTSELAKRAGNADTREEVYPNQESKADKDKFKYSYVHHFCWAGVIYGDHPLAGTQTVLSMERGEFSNGRQFISAISLRRQEIPQGETTIKVKVPLWAQVWEFKSAFRDKGSKKWWGFDFSGPSEESGLQPVISDDEAPIFQQQYLELAKLHEENKLRVDHAEGDETDKSAGTPSDKF